MRIAIGSDHAGFELMKEPAVHVRWCRRFARAGAEIYFRCGQSGPSPRWFRVLREWDRCALRANGFNVSLGCGWNPSPSGDEKVRHARAGGQGIQGGGVGNA